MSDYTHVLSKKIQSLQISVDHERRFANEQLALRHDAEKENIALRKAVHEAREESESRLLEGGRLLAEVEEVNEYLLSEVVGLHCEVDELADELAETEEWREDETYNADKLMLGVEKLVIEKRNLKNELHDLAKELERRENHYSALTSYDDACRVCGACWSTLERATLCCIKG